MPDIVAGPRILLVEDVPVNRVLVRAVLARTRREELQGFMLYEAATLAEARAILDAQQIDLALIDVRLPDGNGLDLARDLAAASASAAGRVKVAIVSASALPDERAAALTSGADGFIAKPFDIARLLDMVVELLDPSRHPAPD